MTVEEMELAFQRPANMERYGYSLGDPKRLFYRGTINRPSYGFSVFASGVVLDHILNGQNTHHYHIDGTFGIVPQGEFRQMLVIHLAIQNHVCSVFLFNHPITFCTSCSARYYRLRDMRHDGPQCLLILIPIFTEHTVHLRTDDASY